MPESLAARHSPQGSCVPLVSTLRHWTLPEPISLRAAEHGVCWADGARNVAAIPPGQALWFL